MHRLKSLINLIAQTLRLTIGINDYDTYFRHMSNNHPEKIPMTKNEFYRYCLERKYPKRNRKNFSCPC